MTSNPGLGASSATSGSAAVSKPASKTTIARNRSERLEILLQDYQSCREDDRVLLQTQANVIGVAVALLTLLAAAVTQTCTFNPPPNQCIRVSPLTLAIAPLPIVAVIAYIIMLGGLATIRSYYMRALEEEIRTYVSQPLSTLRELRPASYVSLIIEVSSLRRGIGFYKYLVLLIFLAVLIVFGGLTTVIALSLDPPLKWAALSFYALVILLLTVAVGRMTKGGRGFFVRTARSMLDRQHRISDIVILKPPTPNERSILSYLLLPRPEDLVKWVIVPASFGISLLVGVQASHINIGYAVAVWLILEYFLYEARYQWNDLRGLARDSVHPQARARKRLPLGRNSSKAARNAQLSAVTMALRIGIVCVAIWILGQPDMAPGYAKGLAGFSAIVILSAIGYEALRADTKWTPPLRMRARDISIWLLVGIGYAVRGCAGFFLGGTDWLSFRMFMVFLFFLAYGVMFVLLTWVLEAAQHCVSEPRGEVMYSDELEHKSHLAALLLFTRYNHLVPTPHPPPGGVSDLGKVAILAGASSFLSPWNLAEIASGLFGGFLAASLLPAQKSVGSYGWLLAAYLVFSLLLPVPPRFLLRCAVCILGGIAIVLSTSLLTDTDARTAALACLPWAAVSIIYIFFRTQSYAGLKAGFVPFVNILRKFARHLWLWSMFHLLGRESFDAVTRPISGASNVSSNVP